MPDILTGKIMQQTNANIEVEDWLDTICDLALEDSSFFTIATKGKAQATHNTKFQWSEFLGTVPEWTIPSDATITTGVHSSATNLAVQINTDTHSLNGLVPDMICEVTKPGTPDVSIYLRVDKIEVSGSTSTVKFKRIVTPAPGSDVFADQEMYDTGLASGSPATDNWLQGKTVKMLYTSKIEGSDDINPVYNIVDNFYNYVTTFSTDSEISWHKAAQLWRHNMTQREWQVSKRAIEHARQIEVAYWFGVGYNELRATSGGVNRQATRGFLNFPTINHRWKQNQHPVATFTYLNFVEWCEQWVMQYNQKTELTGWINPCFLTWLLKAIKEDTNHYMNIDSRGRQGEYGLNFHKLITPHCNINLIVNKTLKQYFGQQPFLAVMDMDKISTRFLSSNGVNLSTAVYKDIQPKASKNFVDNIYSVYGLQVENCECHSVLHLV